MTETTTAVAPILDETDIATLNAARTILSGIPTQHTFEGGVIFESARRADDAVFQALNTLHHYGGQPMTESQLHNREEKS